MKKRKVFYENGMEVKAAGVLVFVKRLQRFYFLMRQERGKWAETGGGKSERVDKSILDTAIRETVEETNGHLFSEHDTWQQCDARLRALITPRTYKIYSPRSKYMLYVVEADIRLKKESMKRFGRKEKHSNIRHRYKWIRRDQIPTLRLRPRLFVSGLLRFAVEDLQSETR